MSRSIYIIEPHPAVRESFSFLVGPLANLTIAGSASSYERAAPELSAVCPDIVLMGLAGANDAPIRALRSACPASQILVASAFQTGLTPSVAQKAGADVCVSRAHGAPSLLPSLRKLVDRLEARPSVPHMDAEGSTEARPLRPRGPLDARTIAQALPRLD